MSRVAAMASLVIRPIEGADVDAVRAVAASANEEFRAAMGEAFFRAYLANVLDVEARRRDATVLVADLGQTIVGTITVYRDVNDEGMPARFPQRTAGLRATAVAPTARGQGIGSRLVDAAIETGCAQGARAIALHTAECMNAATSLYQRHGFSRTPRYDYTANDFFGAREGRLLAALAFVRELGDCDPSAPPGHAGRPHGGRT